MILGIFVGGVVLIVMVIAGYVLLLPGKLIMTVARSVAYRIWGDDENSWIVMPIFLAVLLLILGIDAFIAYSLKLTDLPDSSVAKIVAIGVALYCLGLIALTIALGFMAIVGGLGMWIASLFEALNNAIRGE